MKKFENNEQAVIVYTNSSMDGVLVTVTGYTRISGCEFYIIERCDGSKWHTGYRAIELISSCLCKVSNVK